MHPLDDPFGAALRGPQRRFARSIGTAIAYRPEFSVFFAHPTELTERAYGDLASLAGPGGTIGLRDRDTPLPDGWELLDTFEMVQYTGEDLVVADDAELLEFGPADVPEMSDLAALTRPGPFAERTIELGLYLGYRDPADGRLLGMAGERAKPPGWTEISAVCVHPDARGRGLAARLIRALGARIVATGATPYLHTAGDNPARALYERLGFTLRSSVRMEIVRVPRT